MTFAVKFYLGLHQPSDAKHFELACISINRLRKRKKPIGCADVLLDSGAFTELNLHGKYRHSVSDYAKDIRRLHDDGVVRISAAVSQDYMCEPFILAKTGLDVATHQRLTIERYDALLAENLPVYIMPVLQGFAPSEYANHVRQYGERIKPGAWVGVGSVCKRQGDAKAIWRVLSAIKEERPDIGLHGFGVKTTALQSAAVRELLDTADSMAWSFAARKAGRSANDWRSAAAFAEAINKWAGKKTWQMELSLW